MFREFVEMMFRGGLMRGAREGLEGQPWLPAAGLVGAALLALAMLSWWAGRQGNEGQAGWAMAIGFVRIAIFGAAALVFVAVVTWAWRVVF